MSRRSAVSVLLAAGAVLGAGSTAPADAAIVPSAPTPLAFTSAWSCPAAEVVSGRSSQTGAARTMRVLGRRGKDAGFALVLLPYVATSTPAAAVSVCDPAAAMARRPLGPFGGARLGDPGSDAVAPGARALVGAPGTEAAALRPGDHLDLPPVAAGAVVDVAVQSGVAVAHVRLGPFSAAPQTLDVRSTDAAPVVRVALADGTAIERAAPAPAVVKATLKVRASGRRLRLSGRVQPEAIIVADHPGKSAEETFLPAPDGGTGADAKGRFSLRTRALDRGLRTVTVDTFEQASGIASSWRCRLSWRRSTISRVRCTPRKGQRPNNPTAGISTSPGFAMGAPRTARGAARTPLPLASAAAARATPLAAARVTPAGKLPDGSTPELSSELSAADLTGDGVPEILSASLGGDPTLLVSAPGGWRAATVEHEFAFAARLADDLTGDGLADLWTSQGRAVSGTAEWSASGAPTIDLRPSAPLGPSAFELPTSSESFDSTPPSPLPDATGDGRPEFLTDDTVFGSESVPLGQATALPLTWRVIREKDYEALANLPGLDDVPEETRGDGVVGATSESYTSSRAPLLEVTGISERRKGVITSAVELSTLGAANGWAPTVTGTLTLPGAAQVLAGDPLHGEAVVATWDACGKRGCLVRFLRIDRGGRILASATMRGPRNGEPEAWFVGDGSDADDRAEVVLRPGGADEAGPLQLWASGAGSQKVSALAALANAGKVIAADRPVAAFTRSGAPAGLVVLARRPDRTGAVTVSVVEAG